MRGGGCPSVRVVTTKALGTTAWEPIRGLLKTNTSVRGKMAVNYSNSSSVPTRIPHHHAQHLEHLNIEGSDQYVEPLTLNNHNGSDT